MFKNREIRPQKKMEDIRVAGFQSVDGDFMMRRASIAHGRSVRQGIIVMYD